MTETMAGVRPPGSTHEHRLRARGLTVGYDRVEVIANLDVEIPSGKITAIIGANACGKSTLLKTLARLLRPRAGRVELDGQDLHAMRSVTVAQTLAMLPQSPLAPEGITVGDLVARGRYPRQGLWRRWTSEDDHAVAEALRRTDTLDLVDRVVDELSGGQRQRVWIALALAQQTDILLLDEPTSALDLAHQIDVLELLRELNADAGRTIVLVLHDLNQAARYADHLIGMRGGAIVAEGPATEVITAARVAEIFGLEVAVLDDPVTGTPMVVPLGRR